MRRTVLLLALFCSCWFTACDTGVESSSSSNISDQEEASTDRGISDEVPTEASTTTPLPQTHNCTITGEILEENEFWARREARLIALKADSTTMDESYGPGHRILEVYNSDNCELVRRTTLEVDSSPDFPYYLAQMLYNNGSQLVAINSFSKIYVYDIANDNLIGPTVPKFLNERESSDAQSGMIQRLEVWEDFMIGHAQDEGTFVFDLSDAETPKAMLPFAEHKSGDDYSSMFLLPSEEGGLQVLMPYYDVDEDSFTINPMLTSPDNLDTNVNKSARNNRFLVLRNQEKQAIAFDLQERKKVDLPAELQQSATKDILDWLKK